MKISLVTARLSRFGGGVSAAVHALSRNLMADDTEVHVFGLRDGQWSADAAEWSGIPTTCMNVVGPAAIGFAPEAFGKLRASGADVMHSHGIWTHTSRAVARWSRSTDRPYVVSPHGMLDAWALKRSVWKKKIAAQLYENEHLRRAGCLHALCDAEARTIRDLGFANPICVIPNGIAMPHRDDSSPAPWRAIPDDHRVMLFLGRLHPKKNLASLIEAWPSGAEASGWSLAIAGWDQGGHEETLRALVKKRGIGSAVQFLGPLFGPKKDAALRRARAFILPSLSEGLPMAVLEAWSYGLPVLQTEACNLPQGFRSNASVCISPDPEQMAKDIRAFIERDPEDWASMGRNGRRIAEEMFCWQGVAAQLREVYSWLLNGGQKPASIRLAGESTSRAA
jgi:glycosyltransferase involved in cell wall biosynthesis